MYLERREEQKKQATLVLGNMFIVEVTHTHASIKRNQQSLIVLFLKRGNKIVFFIIMYDMIFIFKEFLVFKKKYS